MGGGRALRTIVTVVMNALVVAAVLLTARMVVQFFGSLAAQPWGGALLSITDFMVLPFDVSSIKTPYGGVFDVAAAVSIVVLLGIEWGLSVVRWRL